MPTNSPTSDAVLDALIRGVEAMQLKIHGNYDYTLRRVGTRLELSKYGNIVATFSATRRGFAAALRTAGLDVESASNVEGGEK